MIPKKQNSKERKEKTGSKGFLKIVPLVVMLILICVIATIIVVTNFGRPQEIAELEKENVATKEEHISAAVDIAATSIGTNVKATFTV